MNTVKKTSKSHIPLDEPLLDGNEKKYLNQCIDTNWISWQGEFVSKTESMIAKYCNTKHSLTVVNGTYALIMALQTVGVVKGDEVIVPTLTMSATAFAASHIGATIIWADSDKDRLTVNINDIIKKITPKTKAIIVVHLYGQPVDTAELIKVTGPKNIYIIEDVAEGLGSILPSGKKVGGVGTIACHSFHNKIIASGEGGAITLNDDDFMKKLIEMRTPSPNNYDNKSIALNNRMSNISCAVATAQLERIEEFILKRRKVAKIYNDYFSDVKGIDLFKEKKGERFVYWRYQITLNNKYPLTRNLLVEKLKSHNIEAREIFSLMSDHPFYKNSSTGVFPNARYLSENSLDLPSGAKISEEKVRNVAELIANPKNL